MFWARTKYDPPYKWRVAKIFALLAIKAVADARDCLREAAISFTADSSPVFSSLGISSTSNKSLLSAAEFSCAGSCCCWEILVVSSWMEEIRGSRMAFLDCCCFPFFVFLCCSTHAWTTTVVQRISSTPNRYS